MCRLLVLRQALRLCDRPRGIPIQPRFTIQRADPRPVCLWPWWEASGWKNGQYRYSRSTTAPFFAGR